MATVNDVVDGVAAALFAAFPEIKRYEERIEQGGKGPAFFIGLVSGGQTKQLGRRYRRTQTFDVHYFHPDDENRPQREIAERLYSALEIIELPDGRARTANMNHQIVDGVMHFTFDCDFYQFAERESVPKIQTIKQRIGMRSP